jgi:hypothetical protein
MKLSLKNSMILAGLATVAVTTVATQAATAAPVRFDGSYIGAGVAGGVIDSGLPNGKRTFGGGIQGRFAVPNAPVSVRANVLFANTNSAIVPTLTYDQAIGKNTNIYAGPGYSFVQKDGQTSPIGNRDSFVLNAGVESEVAKGVVVYTDAKLGLRAYQASPHPALAIQGGVGLKF